jgi:hypothetical protein
MNTPLLARARAALRRRTAMLRARRQDGFATVFTLGVLLTILLGVGLVLDGGMDMDGWVQADNQAQQAARAGAQALDLTVYRETGQTVLNPAQAEQAADAFLAASGASGTVTVTGVTVTVTVTHIQHTTLLRFVGIETLTSHASANATAEQTS